MSFLGQEFLSAEEGSALLAIARASLETWTRTGTKLFLDELELTESLRTPAGAFVTLRREGALRGCIGITESILPLAETVRDSTVNSASRDSRFAPVAVHEVDEIRIEISVLPPGEIPGTPYRVVSNPAEIKIGRDGLFIRLGSNRGGLLLPQVPVEQGWDRDAFLAGVCKKAGYEEGAWQDPAATLYSFSAQIFQELE